MSLPYNIVLQVQYQTAGLAQVASSIQSQIRGLNTNVNVTANTRQFQGAMTTAAASNPMPAIAGQARQLQQQVTTLSRSTHDLGSQAELSLQRFMAYGLATAPFALLIGSFRSGIKEALNFEKTVIKVAQVSGDTTARIQELTDEVGRLSTTFGVSSSELAETSLIFKQTGLSIQDTKTVLEAMAKSSLAPNFDNMKETSEGAIAVMRQFKVGANDLEGALGSMNAVAGNFAVEARDLITLVQKTGGAFSAVAGQTTAPREALNQLMAVFTSVRATTRESSAEISTGLRTIFTRLQRSQTIDVIEGVGVKLRYTAQEARELGKVELTGQFVGAYEAVRRLSEAMDSIPTTDPRYAKVVEEIGGYRQVSRVIPLIGQQAESLKALQVARAGEISLSIAAERAQDGTLNKLTKVNEEYQKLYRTITDSNGFKGLIGGVTSLATGFADILRFVGPLVPTLAAIAAVKIAPLIGRIGQNLVIPRSEQQPPGFIVPRPRGFAGGGVVPGSGHGDIIPAALTPGEFVIRKDAAAKIGYGRLHEANGGQGTVKTLLTPGEFVFSKDAARSIGIARLNKLNHADKEPQRFAKGGLVGGPLGINPQYSAAIAAGATPGESSVPVTGTGSLFSMANSTHELADQYKNLMLKLLSSARTMVKGIDKTEIDAIKELEQLAGSTGVSSSQFTEKLSQLNPGNYLKNATLMHASDSSGVVAVDLKGNDGVPEGDVITTTASKGKPTNTSFDAIARRRNADAERKRKKRAEVAASEPPVSTGFESESNEARNAESIRTRNVEAAAELLKHPAVQQLYTKKTQQDDNWSEAFYTHAGIEKQNQSGFFAPGFNPANPEHIERETSQLRKKIQTDLQMSKNRDYRGDRRHVSMNRMEEQQGDIFAAPEAPIDTDELKGMSTSRALALVQQQLTAKKKFPKLDLSSQVDFSPENPGAVLDKKFFDSLELKTGPAFNEEVGKLNNLGVFEQTTPERLELARQTLRPSPSVPPVDVKKPSPVAAPPVKKNEAHRGTEEIARERTDLRKRRQTVDAVSAPTPPKPAERISLPVFPQSVPLSLIPDPYSGAEKFKNRQFDVSKPAGMNPELTSGLWPQVQITPSAVKPTTPTKPSTVEEMIARKQLELFNQKRITRGEANSATGYNTGLKPTAAELLLRRRLASTDIPVPFYVPHQAIKESKFTNKDFSEMQIQGYSPEMVARLKAEIDGEKTKPKSKPEPAAGIAEPAASPLAIGWNPPQAFPSMVLPPGEAASRWVSKQNTREEQAAQTGQPPLAISDKRLSLPGNPFRIRREFNANIDSPWNITTGQSLLLKQAQSDEIHRGHSSALLGLSVINRESLKSGFHQKPGELFRDVATPKQHEIDSESDFPRHSFSDWQFESEIPALAQAGNIYNNRLENLQDSAEYGSGPLDEMIGESREESTKKRKEIDRIAHKRIPPKPKTHTGASSSNLPLDQFNPLSPGFLMPEPPFIPQRRTVIQRQIREQVSYHQVNLEQEQRRLEEANSVYYGLRGEKVKFEDGGHKQFPKDEAREIYRRRLEEIETAKIARKRAYDELVAANELKTANRGDTITSPPTGHGDTFSMKQNIASTPALSPLAEANSSQTSPGVFVDNRPINKDVTHSDPLNSLALNSSGPFSGSSLVRPPAFSEQFIPASHFGKPPQKPPVPPVATGGLPPEPDPSGQPQKKRAKTTGEIIAELKAKMAADNGGVPPKPPREVYPGTDVSVVIPPKPKPKSPAEPVASGGADEWGSNYRNSNASRGTPDLTEPEFVDFWKNVDNTRRRHRKEMPPPATPAPPPKFTTIDLVRHRKQTQDASEFFSRTPVRNFSEQTQGEISQSYGGQANHFVNTQFEDFHQDLLRRNFPGMTAIERDRVTAEQLKMAEDEAKQKRATLHFSDQGDTRVPLVRQNFLQQLNTQRVGMGAKPLDIQQEAAKFFASRSTLPQKPASRVFSVEARERSRAMADQEIARKEKQLSGPLSDASRQEIHAEELRKSQALLQQELRDSLYHNLSKTMGHDEAFRQSGDMAAAAQKEDLPLVFHGKSVVQGTKLSYDRMTQQGVKPDFMRDRNREVLTYNELLERRKQQAAYKTAGGQSRFDRLPEELRASLISQNHQAESQRLTKELQQSESFIGGKTLDLNNDEAYTYGRLRAVSSAANNSRIAINRKTGAVAGTEAGSNLFRNIYGRTADSFLTPPPPVGPYENQRLGISSQSNEEYFSGRVREKTAGEIKRRGGEALLSQQTIGEIRSKTEIREQKNIQRELQNAEERLLAKTNPLMSLAERRREATARVVAALEKEHLILNERMKREQEAESKGHPVDYTGVALPKTFARNSRGDLLGLSETFAQVQRQLTESIRTATKNFADKYRQGLEVTLSQSGINPANATKAQRDAAAATFKASPEFKSSQQALAAEIARLKQDALSGTNMSRGDRLKTALSDGYEGFQNAMGAVRRRTERIDNSMFGRSLQTGMMPLTMTAMPMLSQSVTESAGKAENAALSDEGSATYIRNKGIAGAMEFASAGAIVGTAIAGPLGTVVGAVGGAIVGGAVGYVNAVKDAANEIRQVKMNIALEKFQEQIKNFITSAGSVFETEFSGNLEKGKRLREVSLVSESGILRNMDSHQKEMTDKNISESSHWFGTRFRPEEFFASQTRGIRQDYGGQLPQITEAVSSQAAILGRKQSTLKLDEGSNKFNVERELMGPVGSLNRVLIGMVAQIRQIPVAQVMEEMMETFREGQKQERNRVNKLGKDISDERNINTFTRFASALQSAGDEIEKFAVQTQYLSESLSGQFGSSKISLGLGKLEQLGRFDGAGMEPIRAVASVNKEQGSSLEKAGEAAVSLRQNLDNALIAVAQRSYSSSEDLATSVRGLLEKDMGISGKVTRDGKEVSVADLPENNQKSSAINSVIGSLTELMKERGPKAFYEEVGKDPTKLSEKLSGGYTEAIRENTRKSGELIERAGQTFVDKLTEIRRAMSKFAELNFDSSRAGVDALRTKMEFAAEKTFSSRRATDALPLEDLNKPFQDRQEALTGMKGKAANDPAAIGNVFRKTLDDLKLAEAAQKEAIRTEGGPGSKKFEDAAMAADKLKQKSENYQTALVKLTEASERNAAAQERLSRIKQDEDSRLSIVEKYATADFETKARMNRGMQLAMTTGTKDVNSLGVEQLKLLFETYRNFGDATIKTKDGPNGEFTGNEMLKQVAAALGGTPFGWKTPKMAKDKTDLEDSISGNMDTRRDALAEMAKNQQTVADRIKTALMDANAVFLNKLNVLFMENQRATLSQKKAETAVESRRQDQLQIHKATLGQAGISDDGQLADVIRARDKISDYYKVSQTLKTREKSSVEMLNSARSFQPGQLEMTDVSSLPFDNTFTVKQKEIAKKYEPLFNKMRESGMPSEDVNSIAMGFAKKASSLKIDRLGGSEVSEQDIEKQMQRQFRNILNDMILEYVKKEKTISGGVESLTPYGKAKKQKEELGQDLKSIRGFNPDNANPAELLAAIEAFSNSKTSFTTLAAEVGLTKTRMQELSRSIDTLTEKIIKAGSPNPKVTEPDGSGTSKDGLVGKARGTDTVPAMLSPGEFIVNPRAAAGNKDLLHGINAGMRPEYLAEGGTVGEQSDSRERRLKRLQEAMLQRDPITTREERLQEEIKKQGQAERMRPGPRIDYKSTEKERKERLREAMLQRDPPGPSWEEKKAQWFLPQKDSEQLRRERLEDAMQQRNPPPSSSVFTFPPAPERTTAIVPGFRTGNVDTDNRFRTAESARVSTSNFINFKARSEAAREMREKALIEMLTARQWRIGFGPKMNQQQIKDKAAEIAEREFRQKVARGYSFGQQAMAQQATDVAYGRQRAGDDSQKQIAQRVLGIQQKGFVEGVRQDNDWQRFGRENVVPQFIPEEKKPRQFANGGHVGGTGSTDSVSALLMPGEFVLTADAVKSIGLANLRQANSARFATGGLVGGGTTAVSSVAASAGMSPEVTQAFARLSSVLGTFSTNFSRDSVSLSDSLLRFCDSAKELTKALEGFPSMIQMSATMTVNHVVTGAEALGSLMPELKKLVEESAKRNVTDMLRKFIPDAGFPPST